MRLSPSTLFCGALEQESGVSIESDNRQEMIALKFSIALIVVLVQLRFSTDEIINVPMEITTMFAFL